MVICILSVVFINVIVFIVKPPRVLAFAEALEFCLDKRGPLKDSDAETWIGCGRCLHVRPFNCRPSPREYASNSKSSSQRFSAR